MSVGLILDTDIGTDVDDALALAFALRHPSIDLRAVTTVSGDAERRASIAATLVRLAGRDDVEAAAGIGGDAVQNGRRVWLGHEGRGVLDASSPPRISARDAVTLLVEECRGGTDLATVGMQTNLHAALQRDAMFARRIPRLTVMGGVFEPIGPDHRRLSPADDHNLNADPEAAAGSLGAGIPTLYVPLDVTVRTYLTEDHLEPLRRGDPLCRALARLVEVWAPVLRRSGRGVVPGQVAVLHDPLAVACLVDTSFVTVERLPVAVGVRDGIVETRVDAGAGRPADVVRSVDASAFAEFLLEVLAAP